MIYYNILNMKTPDCEDCINKPAFEAYAELVTAKEEAARAGFSGGCSVGRIACRGAIKNPFLGEICAARIEQPAVPGVPEVTEMISPAAIVGEIPGYHLNIKRNS
jgi:hypothetical protein